MLLPDVDSAKADRSRTMASARPTTAAASKVLQQGGGGADSVFGYVQSGVHHERSYGMNIYGMTLFIGGP